MSRDKQACDFTIFGVLGDLSKRKLIPSLPPTWIDSIQDAWAESNEPPQKYPAGTWGPVASVALLARDGREWEE